MTDIAYAQVWADHVVSVGEPGETVTVTVLSGDTVFYGDPAVTSTSNFGSLTVGQSASLTNPATWLRSASQSYVQITGQTTSSGVSASSQAAGVYVPYGWGANALGRVAAGQLLRCTALGDSLLFGYYASVLATKPWIQQVRIALQALLGNGGSGFMNTLQTNQSFTSKGIAGLTSYYQGTGDVDNAVVMTGAWTFGQFSGTGGWYIKSTNNTDSVTFKVTGTIIDVCTIRNGAYPAYSYQIDGGAITPVAGGTATTVAVDTIATGLAPGQHTVKIISGSTGANFILSGVAGRNANATPGALVHVLANPGMSLFNLQNDAWASQKGNGGVVYPGGADGFPDLYIIELGANDAANGQTADQWTESVRYQLNAVLDTAPGVAATDVIFVLPHIGTIDNATTPRYQDVMTRARGLAQTYNAALVDCWQAGHNSWQWMNSKGYLGNNANPAIPGTDAVHLCDLGHTWMAGLVKTALRVPFPALA